MCRNRYKSFQMKRLQSDFIMAYNHFIMVYNHFIMTYNHFIMAYNHFIMTYNHLIMACNHFIMAYNNLIMACNHFIMTYGHFIMAYYHFIMACNHSITDASQNYKFPPLHWPSTKIPRFQKFSKFIPLISSASYCMSLITVIILHSPRSHHALRYQDIA